MSSQEKAEKVLSSFLGEYLMMCNKSRGFEREPDLSTQVPITFGREKLINAYENIDSAPVTKVRELINQAEADFELSYRSPIIDENGNFAESRAQARLWLGITQSILGKIPQSLDSPQTQGPGFAFAESASFFLGLGDFRMVGRVIQEWAESLLYAGNDQDALNLFTIAMLTFEFSGEKERGAVVRSREKNTQPSKIDSAFLARGQVPGQEQMTTVLGCRNTTKLRHVCINKLTPHFNSPVAADKPLVSTYVERRSGKVFEVSIERAVSLVECPAFWALFYLGSSFIYDYITVSDDPRSWEIYGGGDFKDKTRNILWVSTPNGGSRVESFGLEQSANVDLNYSGALLDRISYNNWGFILQPKKNALIEVSTSFTNDSFIIRGSQVRNNVPRRSDHSFQIDFRREPNGVSIQQNFFYKGNYDLFELHFSKLLARCRYSNGWNTDSEDFFRDLLKTA